MGRKTLCIPRFFDRPYRGKLRAAVFIKVDRSRKAEEIPSRRKLFKKRDEPCFAISHLGERPEFL